MHSAGTERTAHAPDGRDPVREPARQQIGHPAAVGEAVDINARGVKVVTPSQVIDQVRDECDVAHGLGRRPPRPLACHRRGNPVPDG